MSRIGRQIIIIPENVTVKSEANLVTVTGPKGTLTYSLPAKIEVAVENNQIKVTRLAEDKQTSSNHGSVRAHLNNMVKGVTEGYTKSLDIVGVGYKAELKGDAILFNLGYSHRI